MFYVWIRFLVKTAILCCRLFVACSETNSVQALNMDGDSDGIITKYMKPNKKSFFSGPTTYALTFFFLTFFCGFPKGSQYI